jgi:hypothetical protein
MLRRMFFFSHKVEAGEDGMPTTDVVEVPPQLGNFVVVCLEHSFPLRSEVSAPCAESDQPTI